VNRPCGQYLPLVTAIKEVHVELIRRLVAPPISADVNLRCDDLGCTAFLYACVHDNLEAVELLLAAGADPTATTTWFNQSALDVARDAKLLRRLLQLGLPLEHRDRGGFTPLLRACRDGGLECVEALLAAGADIHATDNKGKGVLHWSALGESPIAFMQLLLDHGKAGGRPLNVNAPAKTGRTPLLLAARCVQPATVEALLAVGADVTAADSQGCTALHHVGGAEDDDSEVEQGLEQGLEQVYQLLISAGGDVFALDNNNNNALQVAFEEHEGNAAVVQLMKQQVALMRRLRAELASISSNLQTLVVGAAAELRRLDRARAELQQCELECERERELNGWADVFASSCVGSWTS